jgi:hypothetical protein
MEFTLRAADTEKKGQRMSGSVSDFATIHPSEKSQSTLGRNEGE